SAKHGQHVRRRLDGDDPTHPAHERPGELAGAGSKVEHDAGRAEPGSLHQPVDGLGGIARPVPLIIAGVHGLEPEPPDPALVRSRGGRLVLHGIGIVAREPRAFEQGARVGYDPERQPTFTQGWASNVAFTEAQRSWGTLRQSKTWKWSTDPSNVHCMGGRVTALLNGRSVRNVTVSPVPQ